MNKTDSCFNKDTTNIQIKRVLMTGVQQKSKGLSDK